MEAITELQQSFFLLRLGLLSHQPCIDWAIERLQLNQEDGDQNVVLLAGVSDRESAIPLTEKIVRRYASLSADVDQALAGKYVVSLHMAYNDQIESIGSLDEKFSKLNRLLNSPDWLVMLGRNCEYATDIPSFIPPFVQEFDYIANLWSSVSTYSEFYTQYSFETSRKHDLV